MHTWRRIYNIIPLHIAHLSLALLSGDPRKNLLWELLGSETTLENERIELYSDSAGFRHLKIH